MMPTALSARGLLLAGASAVLLLRALAAAQGDLVTGVAAVAAALLVGLAFFSSAAGEDPGRDARDARSPPPLLPHAPASSCRTPTGGGEGDRLRGDAYGLVTSPQAVTRGQQHTALRPRISQLLRDLSPLAQLSRELHASALEAVGSFYARFDTVLLAGERDGGKRALEEAPLLLDARSEALDALHALMLAAPEGSALARAAERAWAAVRADTLRSLGTLERLHGGPDGPLRATCILPPYPVNLARAPPHTFTA